MTVRWSAANDALAPLLTTLRDIEFRHGDGPVHGLLPELGVTDPGGWTPATAFTTGRELDGLLDAAKQRWRAQPHAAAALAWKAYVYWVALPALVGYAGHRRVPLPRPENVLVRYAGRQPLLTVALHRPTLAVLPHDPLAFSGRPGVVVCADDAELREQLRRALLDEHFDPILDGLRQRAHLGRRTLLGSLASGVAHALARTADSVPGPILPVIDDILTTLGVADLVEVTAGPRGDLDIHRRTCCLAFTLPAPKVCRSCCIR